MSVAARTVEPAAVVTPGVRDAARSWVRLLRDPLRAYAELRRDHGPAVRLPMTAHRALYLLSRPEHAEHVLVAHQDRYVKAFTYRPLKAFLGDGLLTSEGDTWRRHRRLVQPVFAHRHVQSFGPQMIAAAEARTATWRPGATIDLGAEMRTLTMDVVGRALFGTELAGAAAEIGAAVTSLQDRIVVASLLPFSPDRTRSVAMRIIPGVGAASRTLDALVDRVIADRLAEPHPEPVDLLDLLIASTGDEPPLSGQEIRDEVMTLLLAGHETTANTLTWTLALLSRHPAARERLQDEADRGGDPVWTRAVISEALRLYPPAWTIERDATVDDDIAGVAVPAGSTVVISPYLLHRDASLWPQPLAFDPARFLPGEGADRPKYAYLPFGGGRRACVGAGFAQLETTLVLAAIARRYRLDLAPDASLEPRAAVTLHPRRPVPMIVRTR